MSTNKKHHEHKECGKLECDDDCDLEIVSMKRMYSLLDTTIDKIFEEFIISNKIDQKKVLSMLTTCLVSESVLAARVTGFSITDYKIIVENAVTFAVKSNEKKKPTLTLVK